MKTVSEITENVETDQKYLIKKSEKDNKKTIESLVVFVIILIVTIIAINTIWNGDKDKNTQNKTMDNKKLAQTDSNQTNNNEEDNNIEGRLENILSQIDGVGKVKVLVTYSRTSQLVPLYNENSQESITEETDKEGGKRTINENSSKKDVVYQETNGTKTPITQSIINPKIEGAVITAEGAQNVQIKTNIIKVFEMKK